MRMKKRIRFQGEAKRKKKNKNGQKTDTVYIHLKAYLFCTSSKTAAMTQKRMR